MSVCHDGSFPRKCEDTVRQNHVDMFLISLLYHIAVICQAHFVSKQAEKLTNTNNCGIVKNKLLLVLYNDSDTCLADLRIYCTDRTKDA